LIGQLWDIVALQPVMNVLIVLTEYMMSSFGLAIVALTPDHEADSLHPGVTVHAAQAA